MIDQTAGILKALGEPTRLKIIKFLSLRELCICDLIILGNLGNGAAAGAGFPIGSVAQTVAAFSKCSVLNNSWSNDKNSPLQAYSRRVAEEVFGALEVSTIPTEKYFSVTIYSLVVSEILERYGVKSSCNLQC